MTAEVYLLSPSKATGEKYTYLVKEEMTGKIQPGSICYVPFGGGNRKMQAVVWNLHPEDDGKNSKYKTKAVTEICENLRALLPEEMKLSEEMSGFYACPVGACAKCLIPPEGNKGRETRFAKLAIPADELEERIKTNEFKNITQINVLEYLKEAGTTPVSEIIRNLGTTDSPVKTLQKKGVLEIYTDRVKQTGSEEVEAKPYPEMVLTAKQRAAFELVSGLISKNSFSEVLIHGVTGSGKTEIYLQLIEKVINSGGGAIMLVPEISLTPQAEARFKGRFGNRVAVLHSRLSDNERNLRWERIAAGEANVVLGARSAVFAPLKNLKLVILDEEQELTYKSEEQEPHYHAAEIAMLRLKKTDGVLVYGSATPSLVTYHRAMNKEISYVELDERINARPLPKVEIVNMRDELNAGVRGMFSRRLTEEIEKNLRDGKKSVIFVHRRGFSGNVICTGCGKSYKCAHCNIPMTYHSKTKRLICHYCGNTAPLPDKCPSCGCEKFDRRSFGTEKAEEELKQLFPSIRIVRMDADTTSGKEGHSKIIEKFVAEGDVLLGTQMIAKGHDFPEVTLVGVVSCDSLINFNDYRASERTFQLITQVAGRAGRGDVPGRVILQAMDVDNYAIITACKQDYFEFAKVELPLRKKLNFPPFCIMTVVGFIGKDDRATFDYGKKCRIAFSKEAENMQGVEVLGIMRANVQKVAEKYRWRIIIKTKTREDALELLEKTKLPKQPSGVSGVITDIAPGNMF